MYERFARQAISDLCPIWETLEEDQEQYDLRLPHQTSPVAFRRQADESGRTAEDSKVWAVGLFGSVERAELQRPADQWVCFLEILLSCSLRWWPGERKMITASFGTLTILGTYSTRRRYGVTPNQKAFSATHHFLVSAVSEKAIKVYQLHTTAS